MQEEVVLKRCWLARYWGLAARHGNLHVTVTQIKLWISFSDRNKIGGKKLMCTFSYSIYPT